MSALDGSTIGSSVTTGESRVRTSRFLVPILLWIPALLLLFSFCRNLPSRATQEDFTVFYLSGEAFLHGLNPYRSDLKHTAQARGWTTADVTYATDTPTFILLISPLAALPIGTAHAIWLLVNLVCLVASLAMLFGKDSGIGRSLTWSIIALLVFYPPILGHFSYGQNKLPILLAFVLAMRLMREGHDAWAGIIIGIASLVLLFPLLILGYATLERRWRMLVYALLTIFLGGLSTVALFGLSNSLDFIGAVRFLNDNRAQLYLDIAVNAYLLRFASHLTGSMAVRYLVFALPLFAIRLSVLLLTIRASLAYEPEDDRDWRVYTLWVTAAAVLSPVVWYYYGVLFLLLFAQIASAASRNRCNRRAILMCIAGAALMTIWHFTGTGLGWRPGGTASLIVIANGGLLSLLATFISAYWFVIDGAPEAPPPLLEIPRRTFERIFPRRVEIPAAV